jgi:hypothetical protein
MRRITKTYTPFWIWFLVPFGLFIAFIGAIMVSTTHVLTVPYCSRCARKHKYSPAITWGSVLGVLLLVIAGIVATIKTDSASPFMIALLVAFGVVGVAAKFVSSASPRYLTVDAQNVIIHDVVLGQVVLVAPQPQRPIPSMLRL